MRVYSKEKKKEKKVRTHQTSSNTNHIPFCIAIAHSHKKHTLLRPFKTIQTTNTSGIQFEAKIYSRLSPLPPLPHAHSPPSSNTQPEPGILYNKGTLKKRKKKSGEQSKSKEKKFVVLIQAIQRPPGREVKIHGYSHHECTLYTILSDGADFGGLLGSVEGNCIASRFIFRSTGEEPPIPPATTPGRTATIVPKAELDLDLRRVYEPGEGGGCCWPLSSITGDTGADGLNPGICSTAMRPFHFNWLILPPRIVLRKESSSWMSI